MLTPSLRDPLRHADRLDLGQRITLGIDHMRGLHARQIRAKEAFSIRDRDGRYFRASLTGAGGDGGAALVYELMPTSPESPCHMTLLCAVFARQRMLSVIQKATELGVMCVVPVLTERSVQVGGLAHEKAHAWPAQALRAARQCRRASLPEICDATPLVEAMADARFLTTSRRVVLDERAPAGGLVAQAPTEGLRLVLVVGPEGGFTDDERARLLAAGAKGLRLGGRVLRAETAVLVGLTLLQHAYGDM